MKHTRHYFTLIGLLFLSLTLQAQVESTETSEDILSLAQKQGLATDTIIRPAQEMKITTISSVDLESDEDSQDISALLTSSRDAYVSAASFTFGSARYRIRGYDNQNTAILINGVHMNDRESGLIFYSTWGGLNDATRLTEVANGIDPFRHHFGGVGGATNINTRASAYGKATRFTYSSTNRSYRNRLMATHSTGLMDNGWAFVISGSRRWAEEGYVEGTFYDSYSYFGSAEKKFNNQHSLGFTFLGAPTKSGRAGVAVQEIYDLTGNNFYNPNWGYQNGEKRNSRINHYHQPLAMMNHYWTLSDKTKVNSAISYLFGRGGSTALNWYDAADPRPDYYRYLPNYHDNDPYETYWLNYYTEGWKNDPKIRQLNWDHFYFANRKNLFTANNVNGIDGNSVTGNRAKYIVEERRNDASNLQFSSNITHRQSDNAFYSGGVNISRYKTRQFKVMNDLLGADWWMDVDQFAERDNPDPLMAQNDLDNPNRLIKNGDVFGYDFTGNINTAEAFAQAEYFFRKFDFYVAANLKTTTFWRTGNMRNGRFPENSYGDGEKHNFLNYGVKGGLTYKVTGRHYLTANGAYLTRAPFFRDSYLSSRVYDETIGDLKSETIWSGDASYIIRHPMVRSRISVFYTEFHDQVWNRSYYLDQFNSFVNFVMKGIDKVHAGVEFGADINLSATLQMNVAAGYGEYFYNSRPTVTIMRDNNKELLAQDRVVYAKNFRIGGMPQTAATTGMRYNHTKYWFAGFNANYMTNIYMDFSPERRTEPAVKNYIPTDPQWEDIIMQEVYKGGFTLDVYGGKSWRIRRLGHFINLNLSITNLLDKNDMVIGGFEQLRFKATDVDAFPNKYFYMYGRNFFVNLTYRW